MNHSDPKTRLSADDELSETFLDEYRRGEERGARLSVLEFLSQRGVSDPSLAPDGDFWKLLFRSIQLHFETAGPTAPIIHETDLTYSLRMDRVETACQLRNSLIVLFESWLELPGSENPEIITKFINCYPVECNSATREELLQEMSDVHARYFQVSTGAEFGGYRILDRLGSKGTASVWRASQGDGSLCAIKIPHPEIFWGRGLSIDEWLSRAARAKELLRGDGILPIQGVVRHEDCGGFLVLPLVENATTLDEFIRQEKNSSTYPGVRECVRAVVKLAKSLEVFADYQFLHCDLNPANLFARRTEDGSLELTLFDYEMTGTEQEIQLDQCAVPMKQEFTGPEARNDGAGSWEIRTEFMTHELATTLFCLITRGPSPLPSRPATSSPEVLKEYWARVAPLNIVDKAPSHERALLNSGNPTLGEIFRKATVREASQRLGWSEFGSKLAKWLEQTASTRTSPALGPDPWMPPVRDLGDSFFERPQVSVILDWLEKPDSSAPVVVLSGGPGFGKTTIALRAAAVALERGLRERVFWIDGSSEDSIRYCLAEIAEEFDWNFKGDTNNETAADELVRQGLAILRRSKNGLLIVDNLRDLAAFNSPLLARARENSTETSSHTKDSLDFRRPLGVPLCGLELRRLITCLDPNPELDCKSLKIKVDELDNSSSVDFLFARANDDVHPNRQLDRQSFVETTAARELAEAVGGVILLLDQLGGWLNSNLRREIPVSFDKLLAVYRDMLQAWEMRNFRSSLSHAHPDSYTITILLLLKTLSPQARDLLMYCAALAPAPIPEALFPVSLTPYADGMLPLASSDKVLKTLLREVISVALLRSDGTGRYTMHQAIRDVLQDILLLPAEDLARVNITPGQTIEPRHWKKLARSAIADYFLHQPCEIERDILYQHASYVASQECRTPMDWILLVGFTEDTSFLLDRDEAWLVRVLTGNESPFLYAIVSASDALKRPIETFVQGISVAISALWLLIGENENEATSLEFVCFYSIVVAYRYRCWPTPECNTQGLPFSLDDSLNVVRSQFKDAAVRLFRKPFLPVSLLRRLQAQLAARRFLDVELDWDGALADLEQLALTSQDTPLFKQLVLATAEVAQRCGTLAAQKRARELYFGSGASSNFERFLFDYALSDSEKDQFSAVDVYYMEMNTQDSISNTSEEQEIRMFVLWYWHQGHQLAPAHRLACSRLCLTMWRKNHAVIDDEGFDIRAGGIAVLCGSILAGNPYFGSSPHYGWQFLCEWAAMKFFGKDGLIPELFRTRDLMSDSNAARLARMYVQCIRSDRSREFKLCPCRSGKQYRFCERENGPNHLQKIWDNIVSGGEPPW